MKKFLKFCTPTLAWLAGAKAAFAHEAYVIPYEDFWSGLANPFSMRAFDALKDPHNITLVVVITCGVILLFGANLLFRMTPWGSRVHKFFERYAMLGPHFVRFSVAGAIFFSAASSSFLGPELHLGLMPYADLMRIVLFAASAMFLFGFLVELAALLCLIILGIGFYTYGSYLFTYVNYLGEFIVLLLFGMRVFSLDRYIFGPLRRFRNFEKYETAIVRVFYGVSLIYAAVVVKLLHPDLTISVVTDWNLTQFHWLFPSDPLLVTLGAAFAEMAIGLFILVGFETRLTVLVTLFYITLSLFYFRELVWPHLLLYGISLNLLVQPEIFTLDHLIFKKHRLKMSWWQRLSSPHTPHGKSHNM